MRPSTLIKKVGSLSLRGTLPCIKSSSSSAFSLMASIVACSSGFNCRYSFRKTLILITSLRWFFIPDMSDALLVAELGRDPAEGRHNFGEATLLQVVEVGQAHAH